jgi:hypothetical protein
MNDGILVSGAGYQVRRTNNPPSTRAVTPLLDAGLVSLQSCFC